MEDCTYDETAARSIPLAVRLARLLSSRGVLVVNRHRRPHARETAAALAPFFTEVRLRRVRREADNILVCAQDPRCREPSLTAAAPAESRSRSPRAPCVRESRARQVALNRSGLESSV